MMFYLCEHVLSFAILLILKLLRENRFARRAQRTRPALFDSKIRLEERVAPRHQRPAAGVWHLWPHQPSEWQRSDG